MRNFTISLEVSKIVRIFAVVYGLMTKKPIEMGRVLGWTLHEGKRHTMLCRLAG